MSLLAVSNEVSVLLIAGACLLTGISLAFWAFHRGAKGKQSLEADSPAVLSPTVLSPTALSPAVLKSTALSVEAAAQHHSQSERAA